jgi:hypothetical protein
MVGHCPGPSYLRLSGGRLFVPRCASLCSSYLRPVGSSVDVESRGLFLLHTRAHFTKKKKKNSPVD